MVAKRALEANDLARLTKLCGLFSSEFEGERASAAAKADRFLRDRGLRWPDVLSAVPLLPPPIDPLEDWPKHWRVAVQACQRADAGLSAKTRAFLRVVAAYDHQPSALQLEWLRGILERLTTGRAS